MPVQHHTAQDSCEAAYGLPFAHVGKCFDASLEVINTSPMYYKFEEGRK
jgi:hypothetical protein